LTEFLWLFYDAHGWGSPFHTEVHVKTRKVSAKGFSRASLGLILAGVAGCSRPPVIPGGQSSAVVGAQVGPTLDLPAAAVCPAFEGDPSFTIGTSVAIVPTSIFDPSLPYPFLIATSCDTDIASGPTSHNNIFYTNPNTTPPTLVATITTPNVSTFGWGSLALRGNHGDLIGCTSNPTGIHDVYRINIKTGAATFLFNAVGGDDICDGVAWDGASNTVYQSDDVASVINAFKLDENDILLSSSSFPVPMDTLAPGGAIACPNSGLAVSGDSVWAACDGNVRIEQVDKTTHALITSFPSGIQRTEDVECDPLTFGKDVIWTKEAYINKFSAFEIPLGTCNVGGAPPTIPPVAQTGACCPTGSTDSDHDGLLDCWETDRSTGSQPIKYYIDFDCNGTPDIDLTYGGTLTAPNPSVKDVYVEIDYMAGTQPNAAALNTLRTQFALANVQGAGAASTGVNLHYQVDDQVNSDTINPVSTPFAPCTSSGFAGDVSFDDWKTTAATPQGVPGFFGTAADRTAGTTRLRAKALFFRYGLIAHGLTGSSPTTPSELMGCAELPGNDFIIGVAGLLGGYVVPENQEGILMHELGHNMNLRHGGNINLDNQPNFVSVMNSSLIMNVKQPSRPLDFSRSSLPWTEVAGIVNINGIPQSKVVGSLFWSGGTISAGTAFATAANTTQPTAFNFGTTTDAAARSLDVNGDGLITALPGGYPIPGISLDGSSTGGDWANIVLNFRETSDYAAGVHLSMLSNEEVPGSLYVRISDDTDHDGIVNYLDNCQNVANPDQKDLNHNGIGDACEVVPTVCVAEQRGNLVAKFGYTNRNAPITYPIGSDNTLAGSSTTITAGA